MKRIMIILVLLMLFSGCAAQSTYETVNDEIEILPTPEMRQTFVELPPEAASPTIESGSERLYMCGSYEIRIQTMEGGDFASTAKAVCGYEPDSLTVLQTRREGADCYEFVWACTGEEGDQVGRAAVLDDGNYHYVLSVIGSADDAWENYPLWLSMFQSFSLV